MPDRQVARVQHTASKELARGLRILIVAFGADVALEDDLAQLLTVALHIDNSPLGDIGLDDANRKTGDEPVALPRHLLILLLGRERLPSGHVVALGDGPVRLRHAIHVDGMQVQARHLFEEMGCGRTGCHRHPDRVGEPLRLLRRAQQGVDRRGGIEMRDVLVLEQMPDERVVDLA